MSDGLASLLDSKQVLAAISKVQGNDLVYDSLNYLVFSENDTIVTSVGTICIYRLRMG